MAIRRIHRAVLANRARIDTNGDIVGPKFYWCIELERFVRRWRPRLLRR